jgi:histidinol-phosphate aminotransferase
MSYSFNSFENPFLPAESVQKAAEKGLSEINRYADIQDLKTLKNLLSEYIFNFLPDKIIVSHGSDMLLREIINIFSAGRKIIVFQPSFFHISRFATQQATKIIKIQLSPPNFNFDVDFLLSELKEPTLMLVDNPNNPTGKLILDNTLIEKILKNNNSLLVVDEAFYEYSTHTFAPFIEKYQNLAIIRTMDKAFSLAGLRLAYLLAGEYFLKYLSDYPQLLSKPTIYAAIDSLQNPSEMNQNVMAVISEKERVSKTLKELNFEIYPSFTNFLLVKSPIAELQTILLQKDIQIYDLSNTYLSNFYVITIGTFDENDVLINTIWKIKTI